ncbi:MAG: Gfo/Idh/MocA family oxidoreductase [Verrucomicrobiota bacterium]|jgi:predicted dehydrogenase|nr:Gfo/Idh/MocA family oxidoreductase [Verrucomicrobiota bacterium]
MNRRRILASLPAVFAAHSLAASSGKKLRVAVIGHTGRGNYGHGLDTMWLKIPAVEIVAVADADAAGLAGALQKLGVTQGFADYRQMLSEVKPDIVAIGPRHVDQHRDMLLTAIKFGAKGIYIEKPFVRSPAEADEVIAAAEKAGVKIAIAHRNRYHPALAMAAKLIADGAIGRVLEMRGRGKEDPRGGSLDMWVLGSHVMGVALALGGTPRACTAGVFQGGKPLTKAAVKEGDEGIGLLAGDEVHARFEMANGVPFFFDSIKDARLKKPAYDDPASFGLQVFGNAGVIDFRMDQEPFAWIQTGSAARQPVLADKDIAKQVSSHEIPGLDLIDAIQNNRAPLCDAAHGREITEMISAVFESHRLNGQRVTFPLQTRQNPLTLL